MAKTEKDPRKINTEKNKSPWDVTLRSSVIFKKSDGKGLGDGNREESLVFTVF